jgi:DNA-binding LacI/PurR family transcriptional regulator
MTKIVDVARRAGVSISTVSYALSGKRSIAEATRQRILQVIAELDYHPHAIAQGLASRRSHTIGVFYPTDVDSLSGIQIKLVNDIARSCTDMGYSIMVWSTDLEASQIWQLVRKNLLEGVILTEVRRFDARAKLLKSKNYPFVLIGRCQDLSEVNYVDVDFYRLMQLLVDHLADLGHQRIAFIHASPEMLKSGYNLALTALESFNESIQRRNLNGQEYPCKSTARHAYDLTKTILKQDPSITSIITIFDRITPAILQAIRDIGLKIPEHISVVSSFDNEIAELMTPPLTGMQSSGSESLGQMAAEILLKTLETGNSQYVQRLLQPRLEIRQSAGPCTPA